MYIHLDYTIVYVQVPLNQVSSQWSLQGLEPSDKNQTTTQKFLSVFHTYNLCHVMFEVCEDSLVCM